jgi:iron complex transport system ATP-binding protein
MILNVNNLAFHYKSHEILKDVNFSIKKGEITVILGPNGVGKTTLLKHLDQMSGGELQKVSIARALVQQTDLLLMDEPTSSLDLKNQTDVLSLIRHIVKGHNIAAVMTMHDLNTALRYADQYIFLNDKTIYGVGKTNEISSKMVEDVYEVPVEIVYHKGSPVVVPIENEKAA